MKKFDLIGYDSPSYWAGYSMPCLVVPVYEKMTNLEVVEELRTELNMCFDMFEYLWDKEHDKLFEKYCSSVLQKPEDIFVDPEYEHELSDLDEPMQLYFSFCNPVLVNGIWFQNP